MTHALKTWPEYYKKVNDGSKRFEIRKDDRPFKEGDTIILQEWNPDTKLYTGGESEFRIGYIIRDYPTAIKKGYCVMSLIDRSEYL